MDTLNTKITYVVLVHFNELPMQKLAANQNVEKFSKAFGFRQAEVRQDNTRNLVGFLFRSGLFNSSDGGQVAIKRLELEDRKLIIEMEGNSDQAAEFYSYLVSNFADLAERTHENFLEPILVAFESEIIAHLFFPVTNLLSQDYLQFIQTEAVEKIGSEYGNVRIIPATIAFDVDVLVKDTYLSDHRIALTRKEFSVQPAVGHPIEEQIYISKAPVDTQTHVKLLEHLEAAMSRK